ncbi:epoxyqueuosine reductase QueH [Isobaculum melis]|uniref:Epoxyqueuosine reductase QueH n=1 Tax=Isobaculum melis TaxID=142588 RepID=A0A1H9TYZ0_9LACT|nr:epoxyqueuosine reductase QueH [Isobaculum melis]SES02282.1 hypothetical protein SAMN04488559_11825 [Isobaculum melis]
MAIDAGEVLAKLVPNQKINYHRVLGKMIDSWVKEHLRPTILLHSCCAPCSTYTLEYLSAFANVTIYFANSNIHPRIEYQRRALVQKNFIDDFNTMTGQQVGFIEAPYQPQDFLAKVKGLENEPEGGARCHVCYQMRLDLAAQKAKELGFDYFGSALTLSPKKNSQKINEIGLEVQELFKVQYLPSDFKKNKGYQRSIEMCKEYEVYRQCYCGCVFGAKAQGVDLKEAVKNAKEAMREADLLADRSEQLARISCHLQNKAKK